LKKSQLQLIISSLKNNVALQLLCKLCTTPRVRSSRLWM